MIFKDGDIIYSDLQNSIEILEYVKSYKKFNPRIANLGSERIWKEKDLQQIENSQKEET